MVQNKPQFKGSQNNSYFYPRLKKTRFTKYDNLGSYFLLIIIIFIIICFFFRFVYLFIYVIIIINIVIYCLLLILPIEGP